MSTPLDADRPVRVALAIALLRPCILCGGRGAIAGLFVPHAGSPMVAYSLCGACFARPDRKERAEDVIFGGRAA
jgi:hypothetical protein